MQATISTQLTARDVDLALWLAPTCGTIVTRGK